MKKIQVPLTWTRDATGTKIVYRPTYSVFNTITASPRENTTIYVMEQIICAQRGRSDGQWNKSVHYQNIEPRTDGLSNTITGVTKDNLMFEYEKINEEYIIEKKIRIRKLTERECFRLMGVDDADIDKIKNAGISKSQQYKMAGNSIVVDVLYHIFYKAFVLTQNDDNQLELF